MRAFATMPPRARAIRLSHQVTRAEREAERYQLVGASLAAKHYRKRAARLRYRLSVIEQ